MRKFLFAAAVLFSAPAFSATLEEDARSAQVEAAKGDSIDLGDQDADALMDDLEGRWFPVTGTIKGFNEYATFSCGKIASEIVEVTDDGFTLQRTLKAAASAKNETVLVKTTFKRFADGTYLRFVPNNMLVALGINEKSDPTGQSTIRFLASRANIGKLVRHSDDTLIVSGAGWSEVWARCP